MLDPDAVFRLANSAALLGWLALWLSPAGTRRAPAVRRFSGRALPLLLSLLYVVMLVAHWRGEGGFGSLAEVQALFDVPGVLVAGWVHYLAFDLFVGSWIAERCAAMGWPHWQVLPLLVLTFLLGPVGLLAYALRRAAHGPSSPSLPTGAAA